MRKEVFQLHIVTSNNALQDQTASFFPAAAQKGLLSLLMLYKFPTLKFCLGNQTKWPLVVNNINWVMTNQMIITAKYGSHHFLCYGENEI